ncbi:hypothetical protein [Streptomyces sp. NPDC053048]|uniref:hypothetical protein n=1 Tax=Streptomyces sp. NPDC053048 TaxID=3365694 RepID=UPI0037D34079
MSLDLQAAANKRMRRGLITLAAIVVVLAVVVVLLLLTGGGKKDSDKGSGAGAGKPAPAVTHKPSDTFTQPKNWVLLPEGAGKDNGLPVKFPKSDEGAAAMMVAVIRSSWKLDQKDIERSAVTYSVPQERDEVKAAARDVAAGNRKNAGVPDNGPPPQDLAFSVIPIGVQWSRQDDTHVKVSVNVRTVIGGGNGKEPETQLISTTGMAVWTDGDWKNASVPPVQNPEPFDIGDAGFNGAGWKAIQDGSKK